MLKNFKSLKSFKKYSSIILSAVMLVSGLGFSAVAEDSEAVAAPVTYKDTDGTLLYFDFELDNPTYYNYSNGKTFTLRNDILTNAVHTVTAYKDTLLQRFTGSGGRFLGIYDEAADEGFSANSGKKAAKIAINGYSGGISVRPSENYKGKKLYLFSMYVKSSGDNGRSAPVAFRPCAESSHEYTMSANKLYVYNTGDNKFYDQSTASHSAHTERPEGLNYQINKTDTQWTKIERVFYLENDGKEWLGIGHDSWSSNDPITVYADDIYLGSLLTLEGDNRINATGMESVSKNYSVSAKNSDYSGLITSTEWSLDKEYKGVSVDSNGSLTVTDASPSQTIVLNATVTTSAGTETLTKEISVVNNGAEKYETTAGTILNYDFEIENPVYLKSNGEIAKEGEQIFSIKGLNLYPYRAGDNGNQFQGLSSEAAFKGKKSLFVQQGYLGGIYSAITTQPQVLYVYSMYAKPASDTLDKALKLIDTKNGDSLAGATLVVYSPNLSETNDGKLYTSGGSSVWNLKSENSGEWEKVERVFYSTNETSQSRDIAFSANMGSGNENGCYKFYMDNLYIGRVFTDINGENEIYIPEEGDAQSEYSVEIINPNYRELLKNTVWSVSEASDVAVDSKSGKITVKSTAEPQTVTLTATLTTSAGKETLTKNIRINKNDAKIYATDSNGKKITSPAYSFKYTAELNKESDGEYWAIVAVYSKDGQTLMSLPTLEKISFTEGKADIDVTISDKYSLDNIIVNLMILDNNVQPKAFNYLLK